MQRPIVSIKGLKSDTDRAQRGGWGMLGKAGAIPEVPQPGESEKPWSGEAARTLFPAMRGWPWN